jgi:SAM-dependent methyltransferase
MRTVRLAARQTRRHPDISNSFSTELNDPSRRFLEQMSEDSTVAFDFIRRVNQAARRDGVIDSVAQFDNLSTHAQYRIPYAITAKALKPNDRVLDWGCGNGHFSRFLEMLGTRITGYSFEPPPRSMAGSTNFQFVPGSPTDPRSLPFETGSFDAAVSVGVLEHVWETGGDERASLAELARVIKPEGTLLVFHLPNETGWIESAVRRLRLKKYVHGRRFNESQIRRMFADAGFRVTDIGRYNTLPRAELVSLPAPLRRTAAFARMYDLIDDAAATVAPSICTNFYVVARNSLDGAQ